MRIPYEGYQDRYVRDLAWAIASPSLLCVSDAQIFWPDNGWYIDNGDRLQSWLAGLDENPANLYRFCKEYCGLNHRLGCYFEALLAYWFSHDPSYELLFHNLQINANGRTYGAFDFIVRNVNTDTTIHYEVAVKFYLGVASGAWLGPGKEDSLQRKYTHLTNAQIRLSLHPEAKKILTRHDVHIDGVGIILKGRFYYPLGYPLQAPDLANDGHLSGLWCTQAEFIGNAEYQVLLWVMLDKYQWLSSLILADRYNSLSFIQLNAYWQENKIEYPCCLVALQDDGDEAFRLFVVPDDWPLAV